MSEAEQKMPPSGTITWTEIPVMNMTRAQEFYKSAFDWTLKPMPAVCPKTGKTLDEPNVVLFGVGSVEAGNFRKVAEADHLSAARDGSKSKMGVRVTIAVTSIDETVELIKKAGGEIHMCVFFFFFFFLCEEGGESAIGREAPCFHVT
ncbi:hypothetical protein FRB95_012060 [Tulasnella sp. JGI-2019a]|nr:hypothetical protein FRB95_012060 [Tulasnella sp. JGI-2019a]